MEYFLMELALIFANAGIHAFSKVRLFKTRLQMLIFWAAAFFIGVVWDQFAIWRGHWFYPKGTTLGINLGFMPIEDYIFIFLICYAVLLAFKISEKIANKLTK
ncbi:MAG: lycopene cyclase domain-containing protein [Nanoarchaeota archaeon]|nr:MAG: lycopene cyclase domain-containing protein [Nanoarchaeota archaeon]